jgi:enamine deaminase RidA (YjgF/YER057c/UK114 family)
MTTTTALPMNVLPAPRSNRQGDYIWVSTIYPLDADGGVVHADAPSPFVGESEVAAQTRAVCEGLRGVLAEAGSSLDRVVKAEVYLVAPEDFYEFKLVWREYFPSEPPARTTAIVLDDHLVPGVRLSLQAVALAGDAAAAKETIHVDDVPDPMAAEWAPQATKAGIFVFPSAPPATDFETGIPVKRNPIAPYYGSDA